MFNSFIKKIKKSFIGALAITIIISGIPSNIVGAANINESEKTGYIQPQGERVDYDSDEGFDIPEASLNIYKASSEENYWRKFASTYYRSRMSSEERAFYDSLDRYCMDVLLNDEIYYTPSYVYATGLSITQMSNVYVLFMDANPQYFFLAPYYQYGMMGSKLYIMPYMFDTFIYGSNRATIKEVIRRVVNPWVQEISEISDTDGYEKVKKAYQIVAANVSYDNNAYYDSRYALAHQTVATAIADGWTVCAGYAELLEMLLQASGVNCITVTSEDHEWNQVLIGNYWYNVDITWDDKGSSAGNTFFCLGDTTFRSRGDSSQHIPKSFYSNIRPVCQYDYGKAPAADPKPELKPEPEPDLSEDPKPSDTSNPFVDVSKDNYFYDAVIWAKNNEITTGTDATHFSPIRPCTRKEVVTFIWRAEGCPEPNPAYINRFSDVEKGSFYEKAVAWAVENEITTGKGANTFNPEDTCKREEIVTFLWRANGKPSANNTNKFSDVAPNAYYTDAVAWAVEKKITTGTSTTTFSPAKICDRGQVVTFLYRNNQ